MSSGLVGASPAIATGAQTYNGNQSQTGQGTAASSNVYDPSALALRSATGNSLLNFMDSGTVPQGFTAPPQVMQAYSDAFDRFVTPGLAANFGAGGPQVGAEKSFGMQQLLANLWNTGVGHYLQGAGLGGALSYVPIGANASNSTSGQSSVDANQAQGTPLLSMLLSLAGLTP